MSKFSSRKHSGNGPLSNKGSRTPQNKEKENRFKYPEILKTNIFTLQNRSPQDNLTRVSLSKRKQNQLQFFRFINTLLNRIRVLRQ